MMSLHDTLLGSDSPLHMEESDGASSPPVTRAPRDLPVQASNGHLGGSHD